MRGGYRPGAGRKPKQMEDKYTPMSIKLPPNIVAWLKERKRRTGVPMANIIVEATREYMEKHRAGIYLCPYCRSFGHNIVKQGDTADETLYECARTECKRQYYGYEMVQ